MQLINAPDNSKLLGEVKAGSVVRYQRKFWLVGAGEQDGLITVMDLINGHIASVVPTADVEVFTPEVIFAVPVPEELGGPEIVFTPAMLT